jgi:FkbM family methyltransferase
LKIELQQECGMQALRSITRRLKFFGRACVGRDVWFRPDVRCPVQVLGNIDAQFAVCSDNLRQDAIIYSFGIGTDVSFDLELIRRFGVQLHAFDPTPRSLAWLKDQQIPPSFHVHPYGVAASDGMLRFAPPKSPAHVSHTIVHREGLEHSVSAPVRRIGTIMSDLGHDAIDLLKMDIEGAEYDVLQDILENSIPVRQLCVEFHHRWPEVGVSRTREAISALRAAGYRIFHISQSGEEYSFVGPIGSSLLS